MLSYYWSIRDRCPLCKHVLESDGIPGESRYPDAIATARKFRFCGNLVLFISHCG